MSHPQTVLCIASFFKGNEFLRECGARGARVFLLTREQVLGKAWARDAVEDVMAVTDRRGGWEAYADAALHLARRARVSRVVALEEYDVVTAARVREELCLPGTGSTTARYFHDKLAMRRRALEAGATVPDFVHLLNGEEVAE